MTQNGFSEMIRVSTLVELRGKGVMVVRGGDRPIAVFAHDGKVSAVDNRCPHMGFPLSKGSVRDGILVCHWHEARFEISSGCTFDLFADDAPAYDVEIRGEEVFVSANPRESNLIGRSIQRLEQGLEQNIGLIQAKAILALQRAGESSADIVRQLALFAARNRETWASGLTSLTALCNLEPYLTEKTQFLALFQGSVRVADDCAGRPPRRKRAPLENAEVPFETLKRWFLHWAAVRQRDASERTLLTAIQNGSTQAQLCDMLYSAAMERPYADVGHLLDFTNKAIELLDILEWQQPEEILPLVLNQLVNSRGGEEQGQWRHPIDLLTPINQASADLPELLRQGYGKTWDDTKSIKEALLSDYPLVTMSALREAITQGAKPSQLSKALACAAASRVARFGSANELGDWITVLHTFSYCNAVDQAVQRCPTAEVTRGIFHGAASIYFDRFLNVPPAKLPGERPTDELHLESSDPSELIENFLIALDGQHEGQSAARAVARYLSLGHDITPMFDAMTYAAVREDADFHTIQMVEAGIKVYLAWANEPEGAEILIGVARYLAAHSPTPRARLQTANIALRLHRGDNLAEGDGEE